MDRYIYHTWMDPIGVGTSCFFMKRPSRVPEWFNEVFASTGTTSPFAIRFRIPLGYRKGWRLVENPEGVLAVGVFLVNCFNGSDGSARFSGISDISPT